MSSRQELLSLTDSGIYCPPGDFYLDPSKPVDVAVVTHAHSDHAYAGSNKYFVSEKSELLMKMRLGEEAVLETRRYGEEFEINGVIVSFHPAGHVLGSAQIRVEFEGEVWIYTGDFKLTRDPTCEPFEKVECDVLITEATFALPIYRWTPPDELSRQINSWWRSNIDAEKVSVLFAYSLGKSQRILKSVDPSIGPIFTHGAVENLNKAYRESGVHLPETHYVGDIEDKKEFTGGLVIAPPSAAGTSWLRRFGKHSTAFASGWMAVRGARRRRALDRGFVMSDHADWPGLIEAIDASKAKRVLVTHGFVDPLVRWLNESGKEAEPLK
ncbi:MAG: ligase-associated DNA damage response exonuclease [Acidobacteria bacterium]|nr:MAG: ligase-associated DNA damage response exonuclease [Acidobacteriota bacterium]REJ98216.1 MAG: ligase-associated DNA damage response exonuclease [Acidobacteriota bacterium]REK16960.1 MAG: ligase-associated DNA damage response exonuclease [Acidobacteriota bacterium]REK42870.1 MAG: ligase-associated DNA damage response exonuclease [Acidobacteriota bacterium]